MRGRVIRRLSHFSLRARILILLVGLQVLAIVIVGLVASHSVQQALLAQTRLTVNGIDYGRLRFGVSTRHLTAYQAQIRQQLAWIGAIALVIALFFSLVAGYAITRPLERITQAAARFGRGELDVKLPV